MSKKSEVVIGDDLVYKTPLKWCDEVLPREIGWLRLFAEEKAVRFPWLIGYDDATITMTYCGEPISKENCPYNWKEQIEDILSELDRFRCSHNDITDKEILVKEGIIMLVDFGWATKAEELIPSSWPINLGMTHRLDIHKFDDRYALIKSIEGVLE